MKSELVKMLFLSAVFSHFLTSKQHGLHIRGRGLRTRISAPRERSRRLDEARRRSLPPTLGAQLGHTAGRSGGFLSRDSLQFGRRRVSPPRQATGSADSSTAARHYRRKEGVRRERRRRRRSVRGKEILLGAAVNVSPT